MSSHRTQRQAAHEEPANEPGQSLERPREFGTSLDAIDEYIRNERCDALIREHELREQVLFLRAQLLDRIRKIDALEDRGRRPARENLRLRQARK